MISDRRIELNFRARLRGATASDESTSFQARVARRFIKISLSQKY